MKRRICVVLLILMATALCACTKTEPGGTDIMNTDITEAIKPVPVLVIDVNGKLFYANLEDNSSAQALVTVSGRAGHTRTSTTTDICSHLLKSSDKTAAKTLEQLFA